MLRRSTLALAAALAVATLVAYLPLRNNAFVAYDDDLYVVECAPVRGGISADGAAWAFRSFHGANWFPLTRLSWMLDAELFGVDPRAFHATSLLLHCASAVLLLVALARMTGAPGRSAFAAAVFALHPLHVESVAWAAARKDVLSALFFMLGLLAHERVASSRSPHAWRAARAACMAAGLLAKPILVAFPVVLLLLDAWPLGRLRPAGEGGRRWRILPALCEKAELFALAAAAGVVTLAAQRAGGALQAFDAIPLGERIANALVAAVAYLRLAFWPEGLAVFYPHPRAALPAWKPWAAAALLLTQSALALRAWERRPYLAVGWLWYLALLAPVIGIVQVGGQAMADRYTYLPLVGVAIAVAWGVFDLARTPAARRALAATAVLALGALGAATHRQVAIWRDTQTLFAHALRVTQRNAVAHVSLGVEATRAGRLDEAEAHARAALEISPGMAHAHALGADLLVKQGRPAEAIAAYEAALRILPGTARWHAEIGRLEVELGRVEEGVARLEEAARLDPWNASVLANLGRALERAGRVDAALVRYREAVHLRPDLAEPQGYLGAALLARGEAGAAVAPLEAAVARDPRTAVWRLYLARAHSARGDRDAALRELDAALALDPGVGGAHADRAALLEGAGRIPEAAAAYREALRLGVRDPVVLNNLAWILTTSPDPGVRDAASAVALAEEAAAASDGREASILDTLSLAYAAADRPDDACSAAFRALARAEDAGDAALASEIRARLDPPATASGSSDRFPACSRRSAAPR